MLTVSVALAAYNGERYLKEQIESILIQLKESDELIISVNPSNDRTEEIINKYCKLDNRVRAVFCSKRGVLPNFENAIRNCKNDIVFLSDQDDIWDEKKIETQLQYFNEQALLGVCHDCIYIGVDGEPLATQPKPQKQRYITIKEIIIKNPVQGSCLAFRREIIGLFLPFPQHIPMHDSWIGINICRKGKLLYISKPLLKYRQHQGTVTTRVHKKIETMIKNRVLLIYYFVKQWF